MDPELLAAKLPRSRRAMLASLVASAALCTGCSFAMSKTRMPYEPKAAPTCDPESVLPVLDTAGAVASVRGSPVHEDAASC